MAETVKKVDEDAQATPVAPEETKTDAPVVEEVSVKLSAGHVKRLKDVAGVEDTSSVTVSAGSFPEVTLHENKNTKVPADYAAALVDADIAEQVKS
jgi:hypothetical protein